MIKKKKKKRSGKIEIDLTGPEGNAYYLLGKAKSFCGQLEIDFKPIGEDMTSGDYEHLLGVFEKYFGDLVIMYK